MKASTLCSNVWAEGLVERARAGLAAYLEVALRVWAEYAEEQLAALIRRALGAAHAAPGPGAPRAVGPASAL